MCAAMQLFPLMPTWESSRHMVPSSQYFGMLQGTGLAPSRMVMNNEMLQQGELRVMGCEQESPTGVELTTRHVYVREGVPGFVCKVSCRLWF